MKNCKKCRYSYYKNGRLACAEYSDEFHGTYFVQDKPKCYRFAKRFRCNASYTFTNFGNFEFNLLPALFFYRDYESLNIGFNFLCFAFGLTIYNKLKN